MGRRAESVEWIVTSSDAEALLLEHNLIKRHRPHFNIRLRDDKSYPYIMITMAEEFPRVMFTRQPHRQRQRVLRPYGSAAKVRETLDALGRIFPFRKCRGPQPGPSHRFSVPAVPHQALQRSVCGRCIGGRVPGGGEPGVADFLAGRHNRTVAAMEAEMKVAARDRDFEKAALLRDRLEALRHILERQQVRERYRGRWTSSGSRGTRAGPTCRCSSPGTVCSPTGEPSPWWGSKERPTGRCWSASWASTTPPPSPCPRRSWCRASPPTWRVSVFLEKFAAPA